MNLTFRITTFREKMYKKVNMLETFAPGLVKLVKFVYFLYISCGFCKHSVDINMHALELKGYTNGLGKLFRSS